MDKPSFTGAAVLCVAAAAFCGEAADRQAVVRELLERSRLLQDTHFRVPLPVWRQCVRETATGAVGEPRAPVGMIAEEGLYHLTVSADHAPTVAATVRLRVFDPRQCASVPVLSTAWAWEDIEVNGQPAKLAVLGGWLHLSPTEPGVYAVTAKTPLKNASADGGAFRSRVRRTVRTLLRFDSPGAWDVSVGRAPRRIRGTAGDGTHGQIAVTPRNRLEVTWRRPAVERDRPPRYALSGAVAWNIDAGIQQVAAQLDIAIAGGRTDRLVLGLPASADRVVITGPDVRETRLGGGGATVFLRGRIAEQTRLRVSCEMPLRRGAVQRLEGLAVRDGHWAGGTLVVTNTAGGSEVLAERLAGLKQIALADIPSAASAILAGPPVLACEITSRRWAAEVDVVNLGEFALRESLADLAHYELTFRDDGTVACKATYEIRNRTRQFLRLDLPTGSHTVLARVNEKSRPLTRVPAAPDAWLLPLVRSKASVKGLVSFPVEVVFLCRTEPLARRGEAALPLPRIDLPIAYAWCEAYVPQAMHVARWAGPLRRVEHYSSDTATATLGYGRGLAAEGYKGMERPTATRTPPPSPAKKPVPKPEPKKKPPEAEKPRERRLGLAVLAWLGAGRMRKDVERPQPTPEAKPDKARPKPAIIPPSSGPVSAVPVIEPPSVTPLFAVEGMRLRLARNYYRAGRDYYERGDLEQARKSLEQAIRLAPDAKEPELGNVPRLLANIEVAQGRRALKSRAEKAAGAQVQRELDVGNVPLEKEQQEFLEKGLRAAREGRVAEARAQLEAVQSLGRKLVERGADRREQHARLQIVHEKLAEVRKKEATKAEELVKEVENLERKGDYEAALKTAQQLRQYDAAGKSRIRAKLQSLAEQAARQQSLRHEVKQLRQQLHSLHRKVADLAPKGAAETTLELPEIDAADRGKDREDEHKSLSDIEKDVTRLRNQLGTFKKSLDSLARVPDQPPAKRPPRRPQPTPDLALPLGEITARFGPGKEGEAVRTLSKRIARNPRDAAARIERAQHYLATQQYEKALNDANAALRLHRRAPMANYVRGSVYMRLKKLDDAIHEYKQAATAQPNHLPTRFWLARCYLMKDKLREAVRELNTVVRINPRFTPARLVLASAHLQQGHPDGAISTLKEALRHDPKNVEARRLLGTAYLHKGDDELARKHFDEMLKEDPGAPRAHQILAGIALSRGDANKAVEHCVRALDAEPRNADVHFLLGQAHVRRGRLADARYQFERVLELRGRHPGARMSLAALHQRLGELDLAQEQYQRLIEEDPTLTKPRYGLARLYIRQRRLDKAEGEFNQLLKIDPDKAKVRRALTELRGAKDATPRRGWWSRITGRLPKRERPIIGKRTLIARTETRPADDAERLKEQRPDIYSEAIRGEVVQPRKAIRAKVTAVDPGLGLVVLNAGQQQGVRKGYSLILFRGGKYLGKVIVDEVFPDVSTAHYSQPDMKANVQVGDDVATKLFMDFGAPDGNRREELKRRRHEARTWGMPPKRLPGIRSRRVATVFGGEERKPEAWEARIKEALRKKVSFDFVETPLQDVIAYISSLTEVTMVLDSEAIKDEAPTVTLRATDMPVEQALDWVLKLVGMEHTLQDEAVFVTKPERLKARPVLRMYDVTDLTIDRKAFEGRRKALARGKKADDALGEDFFGDEESDEDEKLTGDKIAEKLRRAIGADSWKKEGAAPRYTIAYRNGRIVVVHTPEVNRQIEDFLMTYRKARGPQVQMGANIVRQQAQGQVLLTDGQSASGVTGGGKASQEELRRFVARNYDWQFDAGGAAGGQRPAPDQTKRLNDLAEKLRFNLGQKVQVSSVNLDLPARAANQLGVAFQTGNNDVRFATIDEAQFRTLIGLDARKSRRGVEANPNRQETIVGTDALLANGWAANVRFAADRGNTLDINNNAIALPHERYVLIDNGGYLTAVRAGEMRHWTERPEAVQFAEVPQDIDVPRVGQMLKFEKTLVEPTDELVLRATYTWKGGGR